MPTQPPTNIRLTLDVSYNLNGQNAAHLASLLNDMVARTIGEGLLTGDTAAEVEKHSVSIAVLSDPDGDSPALDQDNQRGCDYTLRPEENSCWITVGNISVYISRQDEGAVVDLFPQGCEDENCIASTYCMYQESEEAHLERLGLADNLEDIAEWVGQHYQVNFNAEPWAKRQEWIKRYKEAHDND